MAQQVPTVMIDDLRAFHAKHFPGAPEPEHILYGVNQETAEECYDEEDDGLGYYPDGTKRTLTDEQIAMFRHSEIQAILRKRKLQRERREAGELSEEGEAEDDAQDTPCDSASPASAPTNTVQQVQVKTQQWTTSSARTKAKNKRNRNKYKLKKREIRLNKEREQSEGRHVEKGDDESDEWDPWHQANGPDAQKQEALDLDY